MTSRRKAGHSDTRKANPVAEWAAAGVGLLVLLATLGFAVYEGLRGDRSLPDLVVEVTGIVRVEAGYRIAFTAANRGGTSAKGVVIEARLQGATGEPETSEATLDYVPAHSSRGGGLFLRSDPARGRLEVRALGYEIP